MFLDRGAVLSVVMSSTGEQCFSGGVDGTIQCWNTPNPNIDPYDSYGNGTQTCPSVPNWILLPDLCVFWADPLVLRGALCGHTDSVWGLVYSSAHQRLLSCSADGTVRLWDANITSPALAVFNEDKSKQKSQWGFFLFCFFFAFLTTTSAAVCQSWGSPLQWTWSAVIQHTWSHPSLTGRLDSSTWRLVSWSSLWRPLWSLVSTETRAVSFFINEGFYQTFSEQPVLMWLDITMARRPTVDVPN